MPQSAFYAHENVSLDKNVDTTIKLVQTKPEDLDFVYEINKCVDWIKSNNFQKVRNKRLVTGFFKPLFFKGMPTISRLSIT